jgi:hypothetical protein
MHQRIDLASGVVNHDRLHVELIEPPDSPPSVIVSWPAKATVVTPASYPAVAAAITRIIAESATALASIKARRRL